MEQVKSQYQNPSKENIFMSNDEFSTWEERAADPGIEETCEVSACPGEGTERALPPAVSALSPSACTYKNQECRLTVHYENGFSITTEPQEGAFPKTIIQSPYEKLKMSSDDGIRMLYLDFGGKDGEIVSVFL